MMPASSPEHDLLRRVRSFFQRYLAWLHQHLEELEGLEEKLQAETLEAFFVVQEQRSHELEQLLKERRGLLTEWEAAKALNADERAPISELAREAAGLTEQLSKRYEEAVAITDALQATLQPEQESLGQGRKMLRGYRPNIEHSPDFLDRNA